MQNSMAQFTFSALDWKHPFFGKFGPKNQNCQFWPEIWFLDYFEFAEFNGAVHFFCFRSEKAFLGKFGPKNPNC